jgi:hypothetical protein
VCAAGYCPVHTPGHFPGPLRRLILVAMSGFVVDSRTLMAVRDTLGRLHEQLAGMHSGIWQQWGTLGGRALESELEHFCGTWHYGVAELGGQLQDLTRRLGEAAAAYERIEQRITHAGGGSSGASSTGSSGSTGPTHTTSTQHAPAKHTPAAHHTVPKPSDAKHHSSSSGKSYSGGAPLATINGGSRSGSLSGGEKHSGDHDHSAGKHPGVGSGVTVIGGGSGQNGATGGSHHPGDDHHPGRGRSRSGSGTGVTVIGGGSTQGPGGGSGAGGSGTTTIDEKIHHSERRQRAELAAIIKIVEK